MAQSTLNTNIQGINLLAGVEKWRVSERGGQSLLVVLDKENAFPTRVNAFERKVADTENLSAIAGVFENAHNAYKDIREMYPEDMYVVRKASVRGNELVFHE